MKRVSPVATKANAGGNLDFASNGKSGAQASSDEGCLSNENNAAAEATAAHLAATAPGEIDSWAPVMAADALLLRGRLALLDGKLRVSSPIPLWIFHEVGGAYKNGKRGRATTPPRKGRRFGGRTQYKPTRGRVASSMRCINIFETGTEFL